MTNHKTLQHIPTIPAPRHAWIALFDAAYATNVDIHIHQYEHTYHAEESLRLWASAREMRVTEQEVEGADGERWINLRCTWKPGMTIGPCATIHRIRELVRIEPMRCATCHLPTHESESEDGVCLSCIDREGALERDGAPEMPDSNETLGLSQELPLEIARPQ